MIDIYRARKNKNVIEITEYRLERIGTYKLHGCKFSCNKQINKQKIK